MKGRNQISVSIIIPVYGVSAYIERCIKSVIGQTYPVTECIIVDDASPDDSIVKCEKLIAGYNGHILFTILHHDHNRGLSAARNTGTEAAKGDYIFYLDSDDELTPDCIEKLAKPVERDSSIEMVQGNHRVISENPSIGNITREKEYTSLESIRDFFFDQTILPVTAWNKLMQKQFLTDHRLFFMEGILFEDIPWVFYVIKYLQHLYVIPDITYKYCKRNLSISTKTDKTEMTYHFSIIFENIAEHFTPGEEGREAKHYFESYYDYFFENRTKEGFKRAWPFFMKAFAGDEYRKERLRLWVLKLSSKSVFWQKILAALLKMRLLALYPFRQLASLKSKTNKK